MMTHNGPCAERRAWSVREGLDADYQCRTQSRCRCDCHKAIDIDEAITRYFGADDPDPEALANPDYTDNNEPWSGGFADNH